jgi:tRNA/rRNA methyltransferase/tRNA (cytidine32/uridine32-2'-O)-methyltransferase
VIRIVLLRPRVAENVGAAARAMKNFGFTDWAWVQPAFEDLEPARRLAVHAEELLETARRPSTLDEAISDCVWVVGTSSRHVRGKRRLGPRETAMELVERSGDGPVALVFGDERSGMTNEEVDRCHDLSSIAAEDAQPSLNLAQAVLLYAHEVHQARRALHPPPPPALPVAASDAELVGLEETLRRALRERGFLQEEERHAIRDLMSPLVRSRLARREVRLWRAALESLARKG